MKIINIYGQPYAHFPAQIKGTPEGLRALRRALDKAIREGKSTLGKLPHKTTEDIIYAADGEGYEITVECFPDDWEKGKESVWCKPENLVHYSHSKWWRE